MSQQEYQMRLVLFGRGLLSSQNRLGYIDRQLQGHLGCGLRNRMGWCIVSYHEHMLLPLDLLWLGHLMVIHQHQRMLDQHRHQRMNRRCNQDKRADLMVGSLVVRRLLRWQLGQRILYGRLGMLRW